ncbi:MAG TPA: hypothetical protein VF186_00155 [Gaiellaceae bacterium]|jgi:hypothetical protein
MRGLVIVATLATGLVLAGQAAAGRVPRFPAIPGAWSHAELNVKIGRTPHTLVLDRGRIVQLGTTELRLSERDGTEAVIPVTPQTKVVLGRRKASLAALRLRMTVETMRIDGGPAVRIRIG